MNPLISRLLALGLSVALVFTGCGTELGGAFYIVGNTIPEKSTCLVQAQGGGGQQKFRSKGVMDLSVTDAYVAYFLAVNLAPQFESISGFGAEDGRLDQSTIALESATVTMSMDSGIVLQYEPVMRDASQSLGMSASIWGDGQTCDDNRCTTTYTLPVSGEIQPAGTAAVILELLPSNYGRILRHLPIWIQAGAAEGPANINLGSASLNLLFDVTLVGRRHDGKRVSSESFGYAVELCNNCLVRPEYPDEVALTPLEPHGDDEPLNVGEILGSICAPGSDESVVNAWCSVAYTNPSCQQLRCLTGVGQATPTGSELTLYCPGDGVTYGPLAL